jgi:hypothetical protein
MQFNTTRTTHKATLRTPVVPGRVPASRTSLRGMPGIHPSHRQAAFFRLVREAGKELSTQPSMHTALRRRLPPSTQTLADVGEIFEDQCATRRSALGALLGQHMITVTPKPRLLMPAAAQVPFGALAAAGLQAALQSKIPACGRPPGFLPQKLVGGGHGGR